MTKPWRFTVWVEAESRGDAIDALLKVEGIGDNYDWDADDD